MQAPVCDVTAAVHLSRLFSDRSQRECGLGWLQTRTYDQRFSNRSSLWNMELKSWIILLITSLYYCTVVDAGYRPPVRGPPTCKRYKGGLCAPYHANEYIYVLEGDDIRDIESRARGILSSYRDYITKNCLKYGLSIMCHYFLPPCVQNSTTGEYIPRPRRFCRDECNVLVNYICVAEFARGRSYSLLEETTNCSSLPAVGTKEHTQCMRLGLSDYEPKLVRKMENLTVSEGKKVLFKCIITRAESFVWKKDGQVLLDSPRILMQPKYRRMSKLKISSAKVRDSGYYSCSGSNYGGKEETGAWLTVMKNLRPDSTPPRETTKAPRTTLMPAVTTRKKTEPPSACQRYTGKTCAEFLQNSTVFVIREMSMIENGLERILQDINARNILSARCKKYALWAMCLHLHKACEEGSDTPIPRLCRQDCEVLVDDVCRSEVELSNQLPYSKAYIPDCTELPIPGSHLSSYCQPLHIPGYPRARTTPRTIPDANSVECYEGKGEHYTGSVNITEGGYPCRAWSHSAPELEWSHNYCRNPGGVWRRPWCFVSKGDWEYCNLKSCALVRSPSAVKQSPTSHTLYVICAIIAVLVFLCIIVITYVKIQNKRGKSRRSTSSSITMTKGNSSDSSESGKQSVSDVKSFILREIQEVTHGKVKFLELMGEGSFGRVFKGAMMNGDDISPEFITIKKIKDSATPNTLEHFRNEINIIATLQHPNLVCLLGVSAKEGPLFSVFEYPGELNLRDYLQLGVPGFCRDSSRMECCGELVLLEIALQISEGMYFLSENKFIHRDLAARNCYITDQFTVKISNLGLGSYKHPTDYCFMHGNVLLPVRWSAPEVVSCLKFSLQSDVWSYGVVLWEIFSHGQQPHCGLSNQEVIQQIRNRHPLACPDNCPARIYSLMRECWEENPADRLYFRDVFMRLRDLSGDGEADCYKAVRT